MGARAASTLLTAMTGDAEPATDAVVRLAPTLVVRASTDSPRP
jgi:DNA-binding LacI/PurR family transcriptional regulator